MPFKIKGNQQTWRGNIPDRRMLYGSHVKTRVPPRLFDHNIDIFRF